MLLFSYHLTYAYLLLLSFDRAQRCHLPTMIAACDEDRVSTVIMGLGAETIGGDEIQQAINIENDLRMIGTDLGSITSRNAVLWNQGGCLVVLENLTVEVSI
jgi:hypothetical protein